MDPPLDVSKFSMNSFEISDQTCVRIRRSVMLEEDPLVAGFLPCDPDRCHIV